jgi:Rha family phage regulatory protein
LPRRERLRAALRLHSDSGVALVNSRDVAEVFGKRHDHVLRDIDQILTSPNLGASRGWFRPVIYEDAKGDDRRAFDLTRDAVMLLVNRWTGERAMAFSIAQTWAMGARRTQQLQRDRRDRPSLGQISRGDCRRGFPIWLFHRTGPFLCPSDLNFAALGTRVSGAVMIASTHMLPLGGSSLAFLAAA